MDTGITRNGRATNFFHLRLDAIFEAMKTTDSNHAPSNDLEPAYEPPRWEWDDWEREALEGGLDPDLATLGRAVFREAIQHNWPWSLREVCCEPTLGDMLTRAPQAAKQFYEAMLITDGFRLAFVESETGSELIELCNL